MPIIDLISVHQTQLLSISAIALLMAVSPGADFALVTRNAITGSKRAGLYTTLGIATGLWLHIGYSIAGIALVIKNSPWLFDAMKYLGASYLIVLGGLSIYNSKKASPLNSSGKSGISAKSAFSSGFISNALNPKTSLFFLSIFTQLVNASTPLTIQFGYGMIICLAHIIWFSSLSTILTQPKLLAQLRSRKTLIDNVLGAMLIAFGLRIITL
ncbi:MAG: hypothetical protein OFPI_26630 [Osedax symbiont Rs2]|nr:MAG: hypothetical protein OFPI_26630 [Osedax symbiont Rs2]